MLCFHTGKNILCMVGAGISTCEYHSFNITGGKVLVLKVKVSNYLLMFLHLFSDL